MPCHVADVAEHRLALGPDCFVTRDILVNHFLTIVTTEYSVTIPRFGNNALRIIFPAIPLSEYPACEQTHQRALDRVLGPIPNGHHPRSAALADIRCRKNLIGCGILSVRAANISIVAPRLLSKPNSSHPRPGISVALDALWHASPFRSRPYPNGCLRYDQDSRLPLCRLSALVRQLAASAGRPSIVSAVRCTSGPACPMGAI